MLRNSRHYKSIEREPYWTLCFQYEASIDPNKPLKAGYHYLNALNIEVQLGP